MVRQKRYTLNLTKAQLTKLYDLVFVNKKKIPIEVRRRLTDLYNEAFRIKVNGGGA